MSLCCVGWVVSRFMSALLHWLSMASTDKLRKLVGKSEMLEKWKANQLWNGAPTSGLSSGPTAFLCSRAVLSHAPRDQLAAAPFVHLPPRKKGKKTSCRGSKSTGQTRAMATWKHDGGDCKEKFLWWCSVLSKCNVGLQGIRQRQHSTEQNFVW